MSAGQHNFIIEQGTTFNPVLTWKDSSGTPIDLSGYTARMQLREYLESSTVVAELSTENGGIALGGVAGTITLFISATNTANLTESGVYDLEMVQGAVVTRLLEGAFILSKEVTR